MSLEGCPEPDAGGLGNPENVGSALSRCRTNGRRYRSRRTEHAQASPAHAATALSSCQTNGAKYAVGAHAVEIHTEAVGFGGKTLRGLRSPRSVESSYVSAHYRTKCWHICRVTAIRPMAH